MTVCRYYLQGRCRYGNRCWNEHIDPPSPVPQRRENYTWVSPNVTSSRNYTQAQTPRDNFSGQYREPAPRYSYGNDRNWSSSTPRNQYSDRQGWNSTPSGYYGNQGSESYERSKSPRQNTYFQSKPANRFEALGQVNDTGRSDKDSNLITTVKNEITEWVESHIWPFSCRSHFKDVGMCLSGFVDLSPEELRCRAYEAEKNGSFSFYTGIVADAMTEVRKKWDVLKNPTADVIQSIKGYQGTPDFCPDSLKNLIGECVSAPSFGGQVGSGVFAQDSSAKTSGPFSFKQAHVDSSQPLGSPSSAFKSVLPTANKVENSFSAFGFGTPPSSTTGFGSSTTPISASSVASPVSSAFGLSKEKQGVSIKPAVSSQPKSGAYTPLDDLTESERAQFSSQTFTLGKIPSRPPPMELCF